MTLLSRSSLLTFRYNLHALDAVKCSTAGLVKHLTSQCSTAKFLAGAKFQQPRAHTNRVRSMIFKVTNKLSDHVALENQVKIGQLQERLAGSIGSR